MSGRSQTGGGTELEAAVRRLTALADRVRAVRAQLAGAGGAAAHPANNPSLPPSPTPDPGGAKGEAH